MARTPDGAPAGAPELAVVVGTRDRAPHLPAALAALGAIRSTRDWELVLVDNGSRDGTAALLAEFARSAVMPVTIVDEPRPGLGRAHNAGLSATRAVVVAFTDDDCYPAPDYVDQWLAAFADPRVAYGAGRIVLHDPDDFPITIRPETEARPIPPRAFIEPGFVQGANMAFRASVLRAIGGFDPDLGPGGRFNCEDLDAAARAAAAGYRGGFFPGPLVRHHHRRRTPAEVAALRRSYDRGRGAYFASLLLRRSTWRLGALEWVHSFRSKTPGEIARELRAAAEYVVWRGLGSGVTGRG